MLLLKLVSNKIISLHSKDLFITVIMPFGVLMDDKTQKERLEQELRFLKESFEAEVISKEEFEKGKDRIERKLKEIGFGQAQISKENKSEAGEHQQRKQEQIYEAKVDEAIEHKDQEKIKLKVIQDEADEQPIIETAQIKAEDQETKQEIKKETGNEKPTTLTQQKRQSNKLLKFSVIFLILILLIYFSYSSFKKNASLSQEKSVKESEFIPLCSSDYDCRQEGKIGLCLEAGTKNAKCEFKEVQKTEVVVLNDKKSCFNCDAQRILGILESWFGAINVQEIDYNSIEGKDLAQKLDLRLLPAYIFEENLTNSEGFVKFKGSFVKKNSYYVLSEDAAASAYYYKREDIPNKLDLFVILGDQAAVKAENNLKEFLEAFKEVKFEKHPSSDELTGELGIKTFPTFLINNRVKFSGVLAAETIKNNFCELNKLDSCTRNLSKNLI